jgi:hypothetical protein
MPSKPTYENVQDYGAVGDGVADDTVAIQNAINGTITNDQKLVFPKGTYIITGSLSLPTNSDIDFNGAVIKRKALNVTSTLSTSILAGATSIPLVSAVAFPTSGIITIDSEVLSYTGKSGSTLTGAVTIAGSTAASHSAGSTVILHVAATYDMFINSLASSTGDSNISLRNLIINGDCYTDAMDPEIAAERFCGLLLKKVNNSRLENITVINTVNGEIQPANTGVDTKGAICFFDSEDIVCHGLHGNDNLGTAIFIYASRRIRINDSVTYDNSGSGISSGYIPGTLTGCEACEYHNLLSYNNGWGPFYRFSNISVNGYWSKVTNVRSSGCTGAGLDIGHDGKPAHYTIVSNVHSFDNQLEGIVINDSEGVSLTGIYVANNGIFNGDPDHTRNNIYIGGLASHSRISHMVNKLAYGQGVLYDNYVDPNDESVSGGRGHVIDNSSIYENAYSGIYVKQYVQVDVGFGVEVFNNNKKTATSAGVVLHNTYDCRLLGLRTYDIAQEITQTIGVYIIKDTSNIPRNQILFAGGIKDNPMRIKQAGVWKITLDNQIMEDIHEFIPFNDVVSPNGFTGAGWSASEVSGFWKDRNGFIHLVGVFNGGTLAVPAFIMPEGYRPRLIQQFATTANNLHGNLVVYSTGEIYLYDSNVNHYLNGVIYKSEDEYDLYHNPEDTPT